MRKIKNKFVTSYDYAGNVWKCELFEEFSKRFDVDAAYLPKFHALMADGDDLIQSGWTLCRRMYGIHPAVPKLEPDLDPADLRAWPLKEICDRLSLTQEDLDEIFTHLQARWNARKPKPEAEAEPEPEPEPEPTPEVKPEAAPTVPATKSESDQNRSVAELFEEAIQVILEFGFSRAHFAIAKDTAEGLAEVQWFAARLVSLRKMFEEPMAVGTARQALINELFMRRCDDAMLTVLPSSKEFKISQDSKSRIEQEYRKQWEQLEEICPFVKHVTRQVEVLGTFSDAIKAWRDWKADAQNELADGMFTAFGIRIEMRASVQAPEPRYRPGWVLAMLEAKEGLNDPKWKRKIPDRVLKMLDANFRETHAKFVDSGAIRLTDLEGEGAGSEYDSLATPAEDTIHPAEGQIELQDESA